MPKKLERIFEHEYMKKGLSKQQADLIFYKFEAKKEKEKEKERRKA